MKHVLFKSRFAFAIVLILGAVLARADERKGGGSSGGMGGGDIAQHGHCPLIGAGEITTRAFLRGLRQMDDRDAIQRIQRECPLEIHDGECFWKQIRDRASDDRATIEETIRYCNHPSAGLT